MVGDVFHTSVLSVLIGILLVYFQALQLNRVVIQNRMTHELTLFPGMLYVLLVSYFPEYNGLSSPLIANTFILIALESLFATHKKTGSAGRIFDAGLWLSIGGLFYFGYTALLLFGIIGLSSLRTLKSRDWLQYFIGYFTPICIFAMLDFVLHRDLDSMRLHFADNFGTLDFHGLGVQGFLLIGFFALLFLAALVNYGSFKQRKNIHTQKKVDLLLWLLIFSVCAIFIQNRIGPADWLVLTIALGTFVAMVIAQSSQLVVFEIVHFIFLAGTIVLQIWWLLDMT